MATLFISDLHLDPQRPAIIQLFLNFLQQQASGAEALYILGDLFEVWIGDDENSALGQTVSMALKVLGESGVPVYLLHGNRDFLLGNSFAAVSGIQLLPEAKVIDLYGTLTLVMHGDTLCTDDIEYQAFRSQVRAPEWRARILSLPLSQRRMMATQLRDTSQQALRKKAVDIMDVNGEAVVCAMRTHGVYRLIHGHTHRPNIHEWHLDGRVAQRIVLGDWYIQGSVLSCDVTGCRLLKLPLT